MKTLLLLLLISSSSFAAIPVVAPEGVIGSITSAEYSETLVTLKDSVDRDLISNVQVNNTNKWKLSQIWVGLGLTGEIGIGPFKLGTTLKQRFLFVRNP
jgi:hypothetical protein